MKGKFIFVLSCSGLEQALPNKLSIKSGGELEARLIAAQQVWNLNNKDAIIVVAGGRGQPYRRRIEPSSAVMLRYLQEQHGVPLGAIIEEPYSLSTVENGAFIHFILHQLFPQNHVQQITIVTHDYHMKRSAMIMKFFFPYATIIEHPASNIGVANLQEHVQTEKIAISTLHEQLLRYCCSHCKTIFDPSLQTLMQRSPYSI
jgi:uncharacterized SAM-binding protein YcdF (DUF218 family)